MSMCASYLHSIICISNIVSGNFQSQTQPPRRPMNRKPLGRMDQHRQKGSNPYVWEKGDLRKKLASKDNVSEPLEQKSEAVNPILDDSGLAKPQMRANFNPFAAALKSSENRTTFAEIKKPLDTAVQLPVGDQSFKQKNPFGVGSVGNVGQKEKETEGTGNEGRVLKSVKFFRAVLPPNPPSPTTTSSGLPLLF